MKRGALSFLFIFCVSLLAAAQLSMPCYKSTDLGTMVPGAYDLSNTGIVAGQTERWNTTMRAFSARNGQVSSLATLEASTSSAQGVNSVGEVVGTAQLTDGASHPVLWWRQNTIDLGLHGGTWGIASDINERGDVIGCVDGRAVAWFGGTARFLDYPDASFMWPTAINEQRHIIASINLADGQNHAFFYRDGSWTNIDPPGGSAFPASMNAQDVVCGGGAFTNGYHAFLRKGEALVDLDPTAKAGWSECAGINDGGFAVGTFGTASGDRAYLWRNMDEGFLDLNSFVSLPEGTVLTNAVRINNRGEIATMASTPDGLHAILLTPITCSN